MQSFISYCYGDEESRNQPVYKDGTFWTMLGVMVLTVVLSSIVAVPNRLTKYEHREGALIDKELFFLPVPEWVVPLFHLAVYVTYFLGVYLMYRRINDNDEISSDKRNKSKSYMWLLYIVVLSTNFLWTWTYLGSGEPVIAFVFLIALSAAVICQILLAGSKGWGGDVNGAWWLLWPMVVYLLLVAIPLNFSTAFMSNGKSEKSNKSMRKKGGSSGNPLKSLSKSLSSLAP